jgi:hypothetical protein
LREINAAAPKRPLNPAHPPVPLPTIAMLRFRLHASRAFGARSKPREERIYHVAARRSGSGEANQRPGMF